MQRIAFKMQLHKGQEAEYKKRHDEIWPELQHLLKNGGIADYSIFLDESNGALIGVLKIPDISLLNQLPNSPVMQRWWQYMSDIMETNADHSPVQIPLTEMFYLP